jgi:hypothetical protein
MFQTSILSLPASILSLNLGFQCVGEVQRILKEISVEKITPQPAFPKIQWVRKPCFCDEKKSILF